MDANTPSRSERDRQTLVRWLREGADEIEKAHRVLDEFGMPDASDDGTPITLALRIAYALDYLSSEESH